MPRTDKSKMRNVGINIGVHHESGQVVITFQQPGDTVCLTPVEAVKMSKALVEAARIIQTRAT
jgi:hypothetical protein